MNRVALAMLFACGCGAPPAPTQGLLWTSADLLRLKRAGRDIEAIALASQPLKFFSPPFAEAPASTAADGYAISPAFSEGAPAAYITTELWMQFPAVWVQPLYIPVKSYDDAHGATFYAPNTYDPVFSVGAGSRFYSPYWQIFYFVTDRPAGFYHSAKQILDAGFALHEGPGKFCAIAPDELGVALPAGAAPARPITGEPVGIPRGGYGWVEGQQIWFIDLGQNRFTWNGANNVVDEAALFGFATGAGTPVDLPKVGGTGPFHSGKPASAPGGKPQFGALWHLYTVALPPAAGVYVPASLPALRTHVQDQGLLVGAPAAGASRTDPVMGVAANGASCFAKVEVACIWLHSQAAIEANIPDWKISDTGTLASCPLLEYQKGVFGP